MVVHIKQWTRTGTIKQKTTTTKIIIKEYKIKHPLNVHFIMWIYTLIIICWELFIRLT